MGEAGIVAAELLDPTEEGVDVLLGVGAAGADGCLGVDADAVEKDGLAVEEDLGAAGLDGAEADLVFERVRGAVGSGLEGELVELGVRGGPEGEVFSREADYGASRGVGGEVGGEVELGDGDGDGRRTGCAFDVDVAVDCWANRAGRAVKVELVVVDEAGGCGND